MPCNLAVTITKAVVVPEHLQALLTNEIIKQLITAFVAQHPELQKYQSIRCVDNIGTVIVTLGQWDRRVFITPTEVRASFPRYERAEGEKVAQLFTDLLSKGADRLFAAQVKKALSQKFGQVQQTSATVANQGQQQKAVLLSFEA